MEVIEVVYRAPAAKPPRYISLTELERQFQVGMLVQNMSTRVQGVVVSMNQKVGMVTVRLEGGRLARWPSLRIRRVWWL